MPSWGDTNIINQILSLLTLDEGNTSILLILQRFQHGVRIFVGHF